MDVLEIAKKRAEAVAGQDPLRSEAVEAKRKLLDAKAGELYAMAAPLASKPVLFQGKEGRLHISRRPDQLEIAITAREHAQVRDGAILLVDTRERIGYAKACGTSQGWLVQDFGGLTHEFAQIDDAKTFVGNMVGAILKLEEL